MINPQDKPEAQPALAASAGSARCEGWQRYGGAFTLGPVKWEQCKETATVMLKLKQDGKVQTLPGCVTCWNEAIEKGIQILEARPITPNDQDQPRPTAI